ncbi:MAG TPA: LLM class flavin-dependent oxidoreductase [Acidimicrobiales bacterium]|nr:LLM class flavin-dependent oxidoreductase [Acidimicrobiales bacterium]
MTTSVAPIVLALQAHPAAPGGEPAEEAGAGWADLARRAEAAGLDALVVPDHPGSTAAPFVSLAVAAGATDRLRLGTSVANLGVANPLTLAAEVATLNILSAGRALLGVGAGHTPAEWSMLGRRRPGPADRAAHMIRVAEAVVDLLAGRAVTLAAEGADLVDARLGWPGSPQPVPLLVGGSNTTMLRWAGAHAEMVELTGAGPTLPDGAYHAVRWSDQEIDRRVKAVEDGAAGTGRRPVVSALVQGIEVTDDREGRVREMRATWSRAIPEDGLPSVEEMLSSPFIMVGTAGEIADQMVGHRERWGISRYTVRPPLEPVVTVIEALRRAGAAAGPLG